MRAIYELRIESNDQSIIDYHDGDTIDISYFIISAPYFSTIFMSLNTITQFNRRINKLQFIYKL